MMKKIIFGVFVLVLFQAKSYGQYSFGVSSGISFNSAYFGYKFGDKILTYVGFQFANVGITLESSGTRYNYSELFYSNTNVVENFDEKSVTNINLYIPNIGARYYISEKNKIKSYATLNLSKPMIGGKQKFNDKEYDDFKDEIKKIKLFGGEVGYGAEYAFDENFSVGGEFGLRYLHLKSSNESAQTYNNSAQTYNHIEESSNSFSPTISEKSTTKIHISPTYAKFVLNYYF